MKDFNEWTANELTSYAGPVFWVWCTVLTFDGGDAVATEYNLESPTAELLEAKLERFRLLGRLTVHQTGQTVAMPRTK